LYIFIDEHKIVTVRAEVPLKDKIEQILHAFDLKEVPEIKGADAATHEHRGVLEAPDDRLDLLNADEIVEDLRDDWRLALNVDPDKNVDDEGEDLGITVWRCIVRYDPSAASEEETETPSADSEDPKVQAQNAETGDEGGKVSARGMERGSRERGKAAAGGTPEALIASAGKPEDVHVGGAGGLPSRYVEVFVSADSLNKAIDLAFEGFDSVAGKHPVVAADIEADPLIVASDRLTPEEYQELVQPLIGKALELEECRVIHASWVI
jgi:hypothetical protein